MRVVIQSVAGIALLGAALVAFGVSAQASDHGDTPNLMAIPRHDARISDLHVFTQDDNLVLALSTFPNLPGTSYQFPADLTLRFHIDNHSKVSFFNPTDNSQFGGTIEDPKTMGADIMLEFTFDDDGTPYLSATGLTDKQEQGVKIFTGMRDDPFIRGPQKGRNVAAVVAELPLAYVLRERKGGKRHGSGAECPRGHKRKGRCPHQPDETLLIWATSNVPDITGPQSDLGARALRSQCPQPICTAVDGLDLNLRNETSPHRYERLFGIRPDVVIFDTSRPAAFPNGRALTDDVINLVAPFGQNILGNDYPCPSTNDVPFLAEFPYLAAPQFGASPPPSGPACRL